MAETPISDFNLAAGQKADRKEYVLAVQVADGKYEVIGDGVTESALTYNVENEDYTDILGHAGSNLKGMKPSQEFTPFTIQGGSKLAYILLDIMRRNDLTKLQQFTVLQIYGFLGTEGAYEADQQTGCTIIPQSLGGDATVDFPITVSLSNKIVRGTVNVKTKEDETTMAFTKEGVTP